MLQPQFCVSEYGELLNLRSMTKPKSTTKTDLREVIEIDDNTDVKTIVKKMNHNPRAYFLYSPVVGHWQNSQAMFTSLKKHF